MSISLMILFGLAFGMLSTALFSRLMIGMHPFRCGMSISIATLLGAFIGMSIS